MNDDLDYVRERLDPYREYAAESDRHDSDMRVRAYVGNALSKVQVRISDGLDQPTRDLLEAVMLRCMFTDQVFIRKFEHGELGGSLVAALIHSDRRLVELGERAREADADSLRPLLRQIDDEFDARRSPLPVA